MEPVKKIKLFNKDIVVAAISGGPDSMALLYYLLDIKRKVDFRLIVAHVNHKQRVQSDEEYRYVQQFCETEGIEFEGVEFSITHYDNFHQEARRKRYQFFEDIIKKYHANYLYTAHHGDDLMETVLMRIVRGSTLRGYSGFSYLTDMNGYQLIRPFIRLSKEELYLYAKENKIKYYEDESNQKDNYTRNRYRKYILPFFKKEHPQVHQKFYQFHCKTRDYYDYVERTVRSWLKKNYKNHHFLISLYLKEDEFIQRQVLFTILEYEFETEIDQFNDRHIELIYDIIMSAKPNLEAHLPGRVIVRKEYDRLQFQKKLTRCEENESICLQSKLLFRGEHYFEFVEESLVNDNAVCRLSSNEVSLPLFVRTRRNGDRMRVLGLSGSRKVKDIMIDEKIPMQKRDTVPIVVDSQDQIVWIPGLKKSQFNKKKEENCDIILRYYQEGGKNE